MSTVVNFFGRNCIEPGSYAATIYNPTSVVNVAEFGNVMIIDDGLSLATINGVSSEFAGGSGVKGELASGIKSVYEFENYQDFLSFMGGGLIADIAKKIFTPYDGQVGAPKLYYVRAATTVAATITLTLSTGNSLVFKCKNEGLCGNGIAVDGVLKKGYAAKIIEGETENTFRVQVLRGSFAGEDSYGEPFGAYTLAEAVPEIISESDDITTLDEAYSWASNDPNLLALFQITKSGDGTTPLIEITQTLSTGGTTVFLNNNEYDAVLEAIEELDVTFFLGTNTTIAGGMSSDTLGKLFTFLKRDAKFMEHLVIPGGVSGTDLFGATGSSQAIAKYYNSEQVVVVHGAPVVARKDGNGNKTLTSMYLAAAIVGLNAGLAPQTPITFKRVGYQNFAYDLKRKEREKALQAGILHVRNVSGYWCVNQGITTIQNNKKTIADDGQTIELSISLIKAQMNKELILEGQVRFTGLTAAQASPIAVKNFTEAKLKSFVASVGADNLIIDYKNVNVSGSNGDYFITYDFIPNVPVNKTFFVGNMLDFVF